MKSVYTIRTSNDGLMNAAFTNIKAVYDFVTNELAVTEATIDKGDSVRDEQKFNYINFVKQIKHNQSKHRFTVCSIYYGDSDTVEINELGVLSSWR